MTPKPEGPATNGAQGLPNNNSILGYDTETGVSTTSASGAEKRFLNIRAANSQGDL